MLYRATECSKRAASPPRTDSPCGNNGGQLAKTGAPVSDETMPDLTGAMIAQVSTGRQEGCGAVDPDLRRRRDVAAARGGACGEELISFPLSLIHISEPTRPY